MTDEQRMREQFDAFVYERTVNRNMSGPWPTPTELAWLAWQARDAEVQALREELLNYVSADEMAGGEGYGTYLNSEHRRIRALVAGEEGNNHD